MDGWFKLKHVWKMANDRGRGRDKKKDTRFARACDTRTCILCSILLFNLRCFIISVMRTHLMRCMWFHTKRNKNLLRFYWLTEVDVLISLSLIVKLIIFRSNVTFSLTFLGLENHKNAFQSSPLWMCFVKIDSPFRNFWLICVLKRHNVDIFAWGYRKRLLYLSTFTSVYTLTLDQLTAQLNTIA